MLKLQLVNPITVRNFNSRIESIFDSFLDSNNLGSYFDNFKTRFYNIEETENDYKLSIDLPGYLQKDIEVNLENNILNVKANNEKRGLTEQTINLGNGIDSANVVGKLENGVLCLTINKLQKNKKKKIDIL